MRIAFTADWHLGIRSHSINRLGLPSKTQDSIDGVREIVNLAVQNKADIFIMGGDLFHHPQPRPSVIDEAVQILEPLQKKFFQTIVIAGNHDHKPIDGIGAIGLLSKIMQVAAPHIMFFEEDINLNIEDVEFAIRPYTKKVGKLLPVRGTGGKSVMIAHHHFQGAAVGSENMMMAGGVSLTDQTGNADIVLSGHIHKPQEIDLNGRIVLYPGSPARFDFGDRNDLKGFWIVDIEDGKILYRFVPIKLREMVQVELRGEWLNQTDEQAVTDLKARGVEAADVKVVLRCKHAYEADTVRLTELIKRAGAYYLAPIEIELEKRSRAREQSINRESSIERNVALWAQRNKASLGAYAEDEVVGQALQVINDFGN